MLNRLLILLLAGLIALCGATGIVLGMLATNWLTPPRATLHVGLVTLHTLPPCDLDRVVHAPCLLPDSNARWLVRVEIRNPTGQGQQWVLSGGGQALLRMDRR